MPPQLEKNHVVPTAWQDEALARDAQLRDGTCVPCIGSKSLNRWTTREVPTVHFVLVTRRGLRVWAFAGNWVQVFLREHSLDQLGVRFLHLWWTEAPHLDLGLFLESWPGHALHDGSSWPPPPGDWLLALRLQLDLLQAGLSLGELW